MTTITQDNIADITGMDDNTSWTFYTQQLRESDDGTGIITTKPERKYPIAGLLTVELDPGPAIVLAPDGKRYPFTVPDTDSDLWSLIQAAVMIPPSTSADMLAAAVEAYLTAHPPATDTDVAAVTHGATGKTTPVDADEIPLADSASSFTLKKLTWANLKTTVKAALVKGDVGLGNVDNTADTAKPVSTAQQTALDGKQAVLTATAVKTTAYTAAVSDLIPADATSAAFAVTLPAAPADKARIVVKKIDSSTNAVTVTAGGSDVFNASGGGTTLTLALQFQAVQLQYKASGGIWYVVSTDVPLGGLDNRYQLVNQVRQPLRNTCVVIGDSITEWLSAGYLMQPLKADMFFNHLCLDSYQRIKYAGFFAKGGWTLAQIQSDYLPTVLAMSPSPGACVIEGGLNDITVGTTFASSVATLKAMVASLLAKGIWPILWTLPPMSYLSHQANVIAWNDWLRRYAQNNGFGLIDVYAALTQTSGAYITAYDNGDSVHPTVAGHAAIARKGLTDGLAEYFPPNQAALTARSSADTTNLFSASGLNRGLFTTNTSGVGTGFTQGGSTAVASIVAPTTAQDLRGNWQRLTRTTGNTGSGFLSVALSTGWSVGDTLALSFRVNAVGFEAANTGWNMYATQACSSYSTPAGNVTFITAGPVGWKTDHEGLDYTEWVVPAGSSSLTLVLGIDAVGGTGTPSLDIGELTIKNLTTGNLML